MATGVLMLVHTDKFISAAQAEELANKMLVDLALNMGDFYREGPLVFYDREDFAHMPTAEETRGTGFWLNVNLSKDYYFPGYERGDIKLFVQIAEWLEQQIPGCLIFYTHQCNEENAKLFDLSLRDKFLRYHDWISHQPYPLSKSDEARAQRSQVWDDL